MIVFISVLSFSLFYLPILCLQNNKYTETLTLSTLGNIQSAVVESYGWLTIDWWFSSTLCSSWWSVNHFSRSFGQSAPFHLRRSPHKQTGATGEVSDGGKWRESCVGSIRTWNWGNLPLLGEIMWKREETDCFHFRFGQWEDWNQHSERSSASRQPGINKADTGKK